MTPDRSKLPPSSPTEDGVQALDWPAQSGAVDEVLMLLNQRARRRRLRRNGWTVAAVAMLVVGVSSWRWSVTSDTGSALVSHAAGETIRVVEPRYQHLPDGSTVTLRDGAQIAVNFSAGERAVSLLAGTAHFAVAKNPARPFVVRVPGLAVKAVGTAFTVERQLAATTVLVTEGVVEVGSEVPGDTENNRGAIDLARLDAGDGRVFATDPNTGPGAAVASAPNMSDEAKAQQESWRIPRLEFAGAPLAEVLERFNRHNATQFVIVDGELAALRLSGVLRVDRIEAMVFMLEHDFPVRVEQREGEIRLHHRP